MRKVRKIVARQGRAEKIDPKPTSDHLRAPSLDPWDRDRRVRLPHDHLVKSFAYTHAEFEAMA